MDAKDIHPTPGPPLTLDQRQVMAQWRTYFLSGGPKPSTDSLARLQGDQTIAGALEPAIEQAAYATRVLMAKRWALRQLHAMGLLRESKRDRRLRGNARGTG